MIKETEWSKLYGNQRFESLHNRLNSFNLSANNLLLLLGSTLEGLMTNNSKQTFFLISALLVNPLINQILAKISVLNKLFLQSYQCSLKSKSYELFICLYCYGYSH